MRHRIVLILILTFSLLGWGAAAPGDKTETTSDDWVIIHAGTLIYEPGKTPKKRRTVLVKNDRIDRIVAGYKVASDFADVSDARLIDLSSEFVLPGLIDAHVHLGGVFNPMPSGPAREKGAARQLLVVIENANKTLAAGYTTVRSFSDHGGAIFAFQEGVEAGIFLGPRVSSSSAIIRPGVPEISGSNHCYDPSSCERAVRVQIDRGAEVIKIYATCSGGKPCGHQFAPAIFTEEEIRTMVEVANVYQIPVAAHAHGTDGINTALRAGVRSIEHGSYSDAESRRLMLQNGVYYVPTLSVQNRIRQNFLTASEEMKPVMQAFMDQHADRVSAAYHDGVKFGAGSDAGVVPHGSNLDELIWYVKIGMSETEAIRAATVHNAQLLRLDQKIGTIEEGKFADIIATKRNPLEDIEALRDLELIMVGGNVVDRDAF